jgi:hypothetical protein
LFSCCNPSITASSSDATIIVVVVVIIIVNQTILVTALYRQCLLPQNNTKAKLLANTCGMKRRMY